MVLRPVTSTKPGTQRMVGDKSRNEAGEEQCLIVASVMKLCGDVLLVMHNGLMI